MLLHEKMRWIISDPKRTTERTKIILTDRSIIIEPLEFCSIWSDFEGRYHNGTINVFQILKTELFPESQCPAESKTNPRPQFNLIYMIIHDRNWAFVKNFFLRIKFKKKRPRLLFPSNIDSVVYTRIKCFRPRLPRFTKKHHTYVFDTAQGISPSAGY